MLYLILAIICSTLISVIMRLSSHRVSSRLNMLAVNYLTCLSLGIVSAGFANVFPAHESTNTTLLMGIGNGILYLSSFMLMQNSIKKYGVVLPSTFMKLGLLVPMVFSILVFGEMPTWMQLVGFALAVFAIVLINSEPGQSAAGIKPDLILLLIIGGAGDAMSKVFEETGAPQLSSQFLLYTFGAAFLLCCVLMLLRKEKLQGSAVLFGLLIGIPNYYSAKFLLQSLSDIPAVIAYPTYSVATILAITLVGIVFFKEKLSRRQWVSLSIILAALILLNI